ncbi:MAG: LacI family DNA-binding transcriptional regulator [Verrucomicrobiota bacterium]
MPPENKVTQTSIAQKLDLSQALVSRVLNGTRRGVDPETYELIWQYALKVGYRGKGITPHVPLTAAGGRQIGVVLRAGLEPFVQSNFFSHVQVGLHATLQARGFSTVILGSEDTLQLSELGPLPPALVVLGAVKPSFLRRLRDSTRRIVAVNGSYPGLCHTVLPNEAQSLDLLVQHLTGLGHRRFGWIGGLPAYPSHTARFEALQEALAARGLPAVPKRACVVVPHAADRQEGREAVRELMRRPGAPTAIMCFNGVMARGATNALLQDGWKLPRDLSVVAVDATRVSVEESPHITCASANPEQMGRTAAELLLASTGEETESYHNVVLAAQLSIGETSGPVPPAPGPLNPNTKTGGTDRRSNPQAYDLTLVRNRCHRPKD